MAIWLWVGFIAFILAALALDLGVINRKAHVISAPMAFAWTGVTVAMALAFNVAVYFIYEHHWLGMGLPDEAGRGGLNGRTAALLYFTGWLVEYALSVDNIFVIAMIFAYFRIPNAYQHRVLFWGVLGAIVFRVVFIVLGAALLAAFHWVIYVFGGLLVITGVKLLRAPDHDVHPERNPALRLVRRLLPVTATYEGARFFVRRAGRLYATPLLLVLAVVEATDIVFAVDSIPAIFAVTSDPFIVYTSNIFAILGLRALFFLLAGFIERFHHLKVGLGLVLLFVGLKMVASDVYKIPIGISLAVVAGLIGGSVVLSLRRPPAGPAAGREPTLAAAPTPPASPASPEEAKRA